MIISKSKRSLSKEDERREEDDEGDESQTTYFALNVIYILTVFAGLFVFGSLFVLFFFHLNCIKTDNPNRVKIVS